jgi:hypothetical protein
MESQNKTVLAHLQKYHSLTAVQAVGLYKIYRLSGRIYDLRKNGYAVASRLISEKSKHWSEYFLTN